MFPLRSDLLVQLANLIDTASGAKVTGATVTLSLFEEIALNLSSGPAINAVQRLVPGMPVFNVIAFAAGGGADNYKIKIGDQVEGAISGAIARVYTVYTLGGDWDAGPPGTASGWLVLTNQTGDFQAENLDVGSYSAVAAITGNTNQGGTFTLSFDGSTTAAIDGNAALSAIKSALEALGNISSVNVTGDPLDTYPVANGFYVEWTATGDGDVPLLTVNIASLGTSRVTVSEITKGFQGGTVRDVGGGTVGLPIHAHGLVAGDYVYIIGTANYDGEEAIVSVTRDEVVITATYVAETFSGKEEVYIGIKGTNLPSIALNDDGGGDYSASLPEDLQKYIRGKRCILLVTVAKAGVDLLITKKSTTGFYKGT